jgi:branched-chain amino acid transport system permease protein
VENFIAAAIGAILIEFMLEMLRTSFSIGGVTVDMTLWRLVFFGVLLMLTLRFARNGLLVPVIDFFTRGHVAAETVALRAAQSGRGSDDPADADSRETRT